MVNNLDFGSFVLQLYNLVLLLQDYNNTDLMGELQKQDKQYFEKIIKQNDEILTLLRKEDKMKEDILKELLNKTQEKIKEILDNDISPNNLEHLDKLVDIFKDTKEVECMYSGYGNYSGRDVRYNRGNDYGEYGNYGEYGRRGYDRRYRGDDYLDRMSGEYGRYEESRSYGHGEDSDKSFHYMVKSLEDFIKVLYEEAETPQQKQQLMSSLQSSMR